MKQGFLYASLLVAGVAAAISCRPADPRGEYPSVEFSATTGPCHSNGDNCDDTAIWIHPTDPSLSVIIGDDKQGGMLVWNLRGEEVQFLDGSSRMNNVDVRYEFPLSGAFSTGQLHTRVALVAVTNESDGGVTLYKVNPYSSPPGQLEHANGTLQASTLPLGKQLVYGGCMYYSQPTGKYYVFANWKDGTVKQMELVGGPSLGGRVVRTFEVGGRVEGCVADDVLASFYIGEEAEGIWKYGAEPTADASRVEVDSVGSETGLKADVEGLSLYYASGDSGYLIASGQSIGADVRNVVYARQGDNAWLGTFRVSGVKETDGLDVTNFPLGTLFPHGLLVTHDKAEPRSHHVLTPFEWVAAALTLTMDSTWDPRCGPYKACNGTAPGR